jgi:hypothetical protein
MNEAPGISSLLFMNAFPKSKKAAVPGGFLTCEPPYFWIDTSSTSNTRVEFGGIEPSGVPRSP